MNKVKLKKTVGRVWNAVLWLLVILLAVTVVRLIVGQIRGTVTYFFNYSFLRISTESMKNPDHPDEGIDPGDYILIRKVAPEEIQVGDVISFYSSDPAIYGRVNTHRVAAISEGDGGLIFTTKGDNNYLADQYPVKGEDIAGVYVAKLGAVTAIVSFFTNGFAFFLLLMVPVMLVVIFTLNGMLQKRKQALMDERVREEVEKLKAQAARNNLNDGEGQNASEIQTEKTDETDHPGD